VAVAVSFRMAVLIRDAVGTEVAVAVSFRMAVLIRDAEGTEPNCSAVRRESSCNRDEVGADSERMEDGLTKLGYALAVGDVVAETETARGRPTVRSADTEEVARMEADSEYDDELSYSRYKCGLFVDVEYSGEYTLWYSFAEGALLSISLLERIIKMQFPPHLSSTYATPALFNEYCIPSVVVEYPEDALLANDVEPYAVNPSESWVSELWV